MFTLMKEARWTWPVAVHTPKDGGGFEERRFSAVFRDVPEARRKELGAGEDGIIAILREAVVELRDIADEAGTPIPHSAELLDAVLVNPWIRQGLTMAYGEAIAGKPSAAATGN